MKRRRWSKINRCRIAKNTTYTRTRTTQKNSNKIQRDKVKSLKQKFIELGGVDATVSKRITQGPLITPISPLTPKPKKKKRLINKI